MPAPRKFSDVDCGGSLHHRRSRVYSVNTAERAERVNLYAAAFELQSPIPYLPEPSDDDDADAVLA